MFAPWWNFSLLLHPQLASLPWNSGLLPSQPSSVSQFTRQLLTCVQLIFTTRKLWRHIFTLLSTSWLYLIQVVIIYLFSNNNCPTYIALWLQVTIYYSVLHIELPLFESRSLGLSLFSKWGNGNKQPCHDYTW